MLVLTGPTAVGKSEVALRLAEGAGGEIVSVDSMQVYRGLDLGTAKPGATERARVPHHLIDILELHESFDAARFVQLAQAAVEEIRARGRQPVLCGGTGLYFKAFLYGLSRGPEADPVLRAELRKLPMAELLAELAARDPETYARIDRQNPRRVIRAVEVIRLTGGSFAEQRVNWPERRAPAGATVVGLARTPGDLQRRLEARVEAMFERGLVAEVQGLLVRGLAANPVAMQALGYRQVVEHLRGERSLAETIQLVKIRTRQFAKRQMTWFRRQLQVTWVHVEEEEPVEAIVQKVLRCWRESESTQDRERTSHGSARPAGSGGPVP